MSLYKLFMEMNKKELRERVLKLEEDLRDERWQRDITNDRNTLTISIRSHTQAKEMEKTLNESDMRRIKAETKNEMYEEILDKYVTDMNSVKQLAEKCIETMKEQKFIEIGGKN